VPSRSLLAIWREALLAGCGKDKRLLASDGAPQGKPLVQGFDSVGLAPEKAASVGASTQYASSLEKRQIQVNRPSSHRLPSLCSQLLDWFEIGLREAALTAGRSVAASTGI
jgi:hypothetical protein